MRFRYHILPAAFLLAALLPRSPAAEDIGYMFAFGESC